MNNERSLFPPLFRKVDTGGGSEIREKIAEIDSEITDINSDITNIDSAITRLSNNVGNLSNLDTTDKTSLVGAVNEVASAGGGINFSATETEIGTYLGSKMYSKVYTITGVTALGQSSPVVFEAGFDSICDVLINATLIITQDTIKTTYTGYGIEVDGGGNHALLWNPLKASKAISGITDLKLIVVYTKQS